MSQIEFKQASFTLDFMEVTSSGVSVGTFKEFDNVKFTIRLSNGKRPISLVDKTVKLFGKLPDGSPMYQELDIVVLKANTGIVEVIPKKFALSQKGTVRCEMEVFNPDATVLTSGGFEFTVIDKGNDLDGAEGEVGEAIDFLKEISEFSAIIKPEEEKRAAAELVRIDSEAQRVADEEIRLSNEMDRIERFTIMEDKVNTVMSNADIDTIVANALV